MRRFAGRGRVILIVGVVVLVGLGVWWGTRPEPAEPEYQGMSLSWWLGIHEQSVSMFDPSPQTVARFPAQISLDNGASVVLRWGANGSQTPTVRITAKSNSAADVLRAMEPAALPFVIQKLKRHDGMAAQYYNGLYYKISPAIRRWLPKPPIPAWMGRRDAATALRVVGSHSAEAEPLLTKALADDNAEVRHAASETLRIIKSATQDKAGVK